MLLQYELRLVASDNLNENYTTVVIHVNDVNDNPPVFDRPTYETQITEEDDRNLPKRVLKVNKYVAFSYLFCVFRFCCALEYFIHFVLWLFCTFMFSFYLHVFLFFPVVRVELGWA